MTLFTGLSIASLFGMFVLARPQTGTATPPLAADNASMRPVPDHLYFPE